MFNLVYFQMDPSGKSWDDKNSGRIDTYYVILRILLALSHEEAHAEPAWQLAMVVITSAIIFYMLARDQPFFHPVVNDVRCGILMAAFWSGIQGAIGMTVGGYTQPYGFAIMCATLLPEFVLGYAISAWARSQLCKGVYARLKLSETEGETKLSKPGRHAKLAQRIQASRAMENGSDSDDLEASKGLKKGNKKEQQGFDGGEDIFAEIDTIVTEVQKKPVKVFRKETDVELACRFLQNNRMPKALKLADALFDAGMEQFPNSAFLALLKVYYIREFEIQEPVQCVQYLQLAKVLKPAFDIRFFIFFEERALEQEDRKDELQASQLNITRYAEIISMEANARKWHLEALIAMKSLWEYLKTDTASADCVPYLLEIVAINRSKANSYYQQMLSKYPNSKQVLRRYSAFLMTVANDEEQARKLLERAEDIENAEARENTMRSANARLFDELDAYTGRTSHPFDQRFPHEMDPNHPSFLGVVVSNSRRPSVQISEHPSEALPTLHSPPAISNRAMKPRKLSLANVHESISLEPESKTGVDSDGTGSADGAAPQEATRRILDFLHTGNSRAEDDDDNENGKPKKNSLVPVWKKGPGSLPSVPSATSSQRELRQFKYFRGILETRLITPVKKMDLMINIGCIALLALLIIGCVITLVTYNDISSAVNEAYTRMRPRTIAFRRQYPREIIEPWAMQSLHRFLNTLTRTWRDEIIPVLMKYNLNDESTIKIKRKLPAGSSIVTINPYFLAQLLMSHGQALADFTADDIFGPVISNSPHVNIWLDNIDAIGRAFQTVSTQGFQDFIGQCHGNMQVMYGLLVAIPIAALLVGIFIVRPTILNTTEREVQIISLALSLPRKFINERIEQLELEVENIVEELADGEVRGGGAAAVSATSANIPPAAVMKGHSRRKMTRLYASALALFGLTGALMFVPSLERSSAAMDMMGLIELISARSFYTIGSTMYLTEVISNDVTTWLPGEPLMWLADIAQQYRAADERLMSDSTNVPSLLSFPSCKAFVNDVGRCYLEDPNGCDPTRRLYIPEMGLTYNLTTSGLINIGAVWYDAIDQFIHSTAHTGDNPLVTLITELTEDLLGSSTQLNALLLQEVNYKNSSSQSWNIFLFCASLIILTGSYIFIFRRITHTLKQKLLSISELFFSLPMPLIQSIPDLKRFIESGGAMIPSAEKKTR
ncbi:hypothetical protein HK097_008636 [Rhizophlyctis rosea]|uniref:TmcB/TmcC TPR repeats domain-containing protein n=1 Tax=Rhizophlyctis rosea TaxID=64517 RepID=A0AAD5SCT2_9FUNG|nr:hypothetical protein HK097_008636 [Rhizophlyctis rosea]